MGKGGVERKIEIGGRKKEEVERRRSQDIEVVGRRGGEEREVKGENKNRREIKKNER